MGYETAVRFRDRGDRLEFGAGSRLDLSGSAWLFDDFLGDVLEDGYSGASGSDTEASDPAINAAAGGTVRLTTGNSNTNAAADASALTHGLNWQADQGSLIMEARLKVDAITNVQIVVGLTDALASGTLELPFSLSGTTLTSNATDAAAFLFDTAATNDTWHTAGVANDTDATGAPDDTGTAPVADTYQVFRIELSAAGDATFYLDGVRAVQLSGAVSSGTALTPIVVANSTTTSSRNIDVDYLWLQQDR